MKVLHLLQSNRFSGAENVVCQITGMLQNEPDVEMAYCSPEGQIREVLQELDIRFVPLHKFSASEIKKVIKNEKPDIIHAHDMGASFYAAGLCGKIPLISHIHNNAMNSRGFSPKSIAYLLAAIKAKHIFWVAQSAFKGYAFHKLFKKKSSILYNIIDIDTLYQKMHRDTNEYDYDVAYVGRLSFPKNPQRLMNVFQLVKEKMPKVKIAVVGTGELETETKTLAQEYGLLDNISFLGFQSNPLKILHDSKVMVMTSRWEGTPMCALEALALGVPIVSTPTDGVKDLIHYGENGFLSEDDKELADKIVELITNREKQMVFSKNARELSVHYNNIEQYKAQVIQAYKQAGFSAN